MHGVIRTTQTVVTPPAVAPLDLAYARLHLKSISTAEDTLISAWIEAAGHYFREQTGRPIITETRELWLDRFPRGRVRIELPNPPLQSVVIVLYVNGDGDLASFSDGGSPDAPSYAVKAPEGIYATPGWIEPIAGMCWPTARCESGAVRIQYTCGYADAATDVPELLKGILCFLVSHYDQFRSAVHAEMRTSVTVLPLGVQAMMDGFKYSALPSSVLRDDVWPSSWVPWGETWR
jgi:uncharacterized phiE125 gp8 family phage protein